MKNRTGVLTAFLIFISMSMVTSPTVMADGPLYAAWDSLKYNEEIVVFVMNDSKNPIYEDDELLKKIEAAYKEALTEDLFKLLVFVRHTPKLESEFNRKWKENPKKYGKFLIEMRSVEVEQEGFNVAFFLDFSLFQMRQHWTPGEHSTAGVWTQTEYGLGKRPALEKHLAGNVFKKFMNDFVTRVGLAAKLDQATK